MEKVMKKLSALLFVLLFAVALAAQDQPAEATFTKSNKIKIKVTTISLEKYGPMKADKTFKAGETVYINMELRGLQANDQNQVVVQADLNIPALTLDRKNLIDGSTDYEEAVPMYFQIPIASVQKGGFCNVKVVLRDMVAQTYTEFTTSFKLSAEK